MSIQSQSNQRKWKLMLTLGIHLLQIFPGGKSHSHNILHHLCVVIQSFYV